MSSKGIPTPKECPKDPDWLYARYGSWGGPGVITGPGPMDAIAVRDDAPKSSLVIARRPLSQRPAIMRSMPMHMSSATTPRDVQDWRPPTSSYRAAFGWRHDGLELAAPVLERRYRGNATKVMNWEKVWCLLRWLVPAKTKGKL